MFRRMTRSLAVALAASLAIHAQTARGCAVCFGDPDSDMARGAVAGVLFLFGVIGAVLAAVAGIAVTWTVRARRLRRDGVDL